MKNKYVTPIVLLLLGIGLFISLYYVSIYIQPILLPSNNYRLVMIGVTFAASFTVLASIAGFLNDALGILDRIYPQTNSQENTESLEQPNRRILLNHVENAWIKGVLDASLHGAALLDLGIKQDPKAVTKYPWAIKKESTNELLSEGTSILEIFDSIGMGRSLLILGAPGSGKTTMLLELARGLIARAREDITQPIPMVFNLASWTEKLTLADWLAHELNNLYSIPLKTATNWVKADRLLLLLDGLDELGKESYAKCVGAINQFRREHGLTSVVVCSRSQVYEGINTKLSLNGAIEVQPLTHMQVEEYIDNFGNQLASLRLALQKDTTLRKIAETPLFLSIMIVAYHGKQVVDISASTNTGSQHKHLFETYIAQMFERNRHTENSLFNTQEVLRWLSWLAHNMAIYNQMPYLIERIQPTWLGNKKQELFFRGIYTFIISLFIGLSIGIISRSSSSSATGNMFTTLSIVFLFGFQSWFFHSRKPINTTDSLNLNFREAKLVFLKVFTGIFKFGLKAWLLSILIFTTFSLLSFAILSKPPFNLLFSSKDLEIVSISLLVGFPILILFIGLFFGLFSGLFIGLETFELEQTNKPGQRLRYTAGYFILTTLIFWPFCLLFVVLFSIPFKTSVVIGLVLSIYLGLTNFNGNAILKHYILRFILASNNLLPWRLVPFLDHCVDLIFLRRVGGGYIFVHRLLMEHFAEMYVESPTSKGN